MRTFPLHTLVTDGKTEAHSQGQGHAIKYNRVTAVVPMGLHFSPLSLLILVLQGHLTDPLPHPQVPCTHFRETCRALVSWNG